MHKYISENQIFYFQFIYVESILSEFILQH